MKPANPASPRRCKAISPYSERSKVVDAIDSVNKAAMELFKQFLSKQDPLLTDLSLVYNVDRSMLESHVMHLIVKAQTLIQDESPVMLESNSTIESDSDSEEDLDLHIEGLLASSGAAPSKAKATEDYIIDSLESIQKIPIDTKEIRNLTLSGFSFWSDDLRNTVSDRLSAMKIEEITVLKSSINDEKSLGYLTQFNTKHYIFLKSEVGKKWIEISVQDSQSVLLVPLLPEKEMFSIDFQDKCGLNEEDIASFKQFLESKGILPPYITFPENEYLID